MAKAQSSFAEKMLTISVRHVLAAWPKLLKASDSSVSPGAELDACRWAPAPALPKCL